MGNRGALIDDKNAHPSEFWIRIGSGWGRIWILPAVTMTNGLCRLLKDISATFGRDAQWDATPALGVFKFRSRFVKAGGDNDVRVH